MSVLRIGNFGGLMPRLAHRALPDSAAQYAFNAKLSSGELRPWWEMKLLATLGFPGAKTVYRYLYNNLSRVVGFSLFTEVVEAALVNDAFDRVYYTNSSGAYITTKSDLELNIAASRLGVPNPTFSTFTASATGGTGGGPAETRVYVTTLVSKYGEEGSTGPTTSVSGPIDAAFAVQGLNTLNYDAITYPNMTKLRLYRTITTASGVDYRLVNEFPLNVALPNPYSDTVTNTVLASKAVLQSLTWTPPPIGLRGLIALSGGFNAAFKGNEVWFSPPYYPHAFPEDYKLAVEDEIVGLGAFGNTLVIATKGRPAVASGFSPDAMSLEVIKRPYPCSSAQSIISTGTSVIFATPEGLIEFSPSGLENKTEAYLTKDEWAQAFPPGGLMAAMYQSRYFGFYTSILGFTFGLSDPLTAFTQLESSGITGVSQDNVGGGVLVVIGTGVYEWDAKYDGRMEYLWRSKPFMSAKPENFGVVQLRGDFANFAVAVDPVLRTGLTGHTINSQVLGGPMTTWGHSINGPFVAGLSPASAAVNVKVFGDNALRWSGVVLNELPVRLPSGYKAHQWEVEVEGQVGLYSVALAGTAQELEQVP